MLPARHGQTRREVAGLEWVGRHSGADRDANSKKCIDDCRIETRAAALEHDLHCSVRLDAVTIRTRAPESIEDVGDRRDPHLEGNLFAAAYAAFAWIVRVPETTLLMRWIAARGKLSKS